jgi:hypothetical protein
LSNQGHLIHEVNEEEIHEVIRPDHANIKIVHEYGAQMYQAQEPSLPSGKSKIRTPREEQDAYLNTQMIETQKQRLEMQLSQSNPSVDRHTASDHKSSSRYQDQTDGNQDN